MPSSKNIWEVIPLEIPDHPDVAYALATGYPEPEKPSIRCEYCGEEICGSEPIFFYDGDRICENCCRDKIEEDFSIAEIADKLNIQHCEAAFYEED